MTPLPTSPADLLLYGGRILTLVPAQPEAEAIAISDGQILAVGKVTALRPYISSRTQTLACHGQTILPGFIDPHVHLFAWASRLSGIDLGTAQSITDLQRLLANQLVRLAPGEWVRAYGYDEFFLAEKRHPTRYDLDVVCPTHPTLLRHRTGHAAVLNSAALRRAGIDQNFTPPGGGNVERAPLTGEPTGVVYELEKFLRTIIPPLHPHEFTAGVKQASTELLRHGVCSFHDASAGNTLEDFVLFRRFRADGIVSSRVTVMMGIDALPHVVDAKLIPFGDNDQVRLGSLKIMVHESQGAPYPPPDELAELVWQAHRQGFQVALHAVEEGAVCAAIDAIEKAQHSLPRSDHRHRIEHCAVCPPPFIETLATTGSAVVTQPAFLHYYGEKYAAEVDPDLHSWLYRTKSLLGHGVQVAGSSDCPIAPLSPLTGVQAAITRRSRTGIPLNPQERLTLLEALTLFTTAGAWIGFEEARKGKIMPGLLADLVVLDGDLLAIPPAEISSLKVARTIIGGKIVWPP